MPLNDGDIIETGILWDHDTGEITVSTRRRSVESKLRKLGLKPDMNEINGYATFRTHQKNLKISFRGPRKMSPAQRAAVGQRLKKARKKSL